MDHLPRIASIKIVSRLVSALVVLVVACASPSTQPAPPTQAPAPPPTAAAKPTAAPTVPVSQPGTTTAAPTGAAATASTNGGTAAGAAAPTSVATPPSATAPTSASLASSASTPPPTPSSTAVSAAAATATAPTSPAAATVTVKGAYAQASSVQGAVYVGREKGFFSNHGLDVQLSQIGGTQQVAALLSGELQFGALGANEVANADLRGADLVMIATCSDLPIFSLFANKKYKAVTDLAGQSIGVTTAGSATDAAAHLFLKQFDMLDKVKIIPAGGTIPAILAAMDQGNIAGGILSPPTTSRAADAGYGELVNGASLGVPMNHSGIAVSRAYLKDHADVVKNFLTAYQEAWTYSADPANKTDVVAILAQYTQSDDRLAEIGYQAMLPIWTGNKTPRVNPQAVVNLLQVSGVPEAATAKPDQFFDDSLIDAVAPPG